MTSKWMRHQIIDRLSAFSCVLCHILPVFQQNFKQTIRVCFLCVAIYMYIYAALNLKETLCVLGVTNIVTTSRSSCLFLLEPLLKHPSYRRLRQLSTVNNARITAWLNHSLQAILSVASSLPSKKISTGNDGAVSVVNSFALLNFRSDSDVMFARDMLGATQLNLPRPN